MTAPPPEKVAVPAASQYRAAGLGLAAAAVPEAMGVEASGKAAGGWPREGEQPPANRAASSARKNAA